MKISENDFDSLRDALAALVDAARRDERAGIDAASCGTAQDWRRAHAATDAFHESQTLVEQRITRIILDYAKAGAYEERLKIIANLKASK